VAAPGDFFVVRLLSPVMTVGGGTVIGTDTARMRRTPEWAARLEEEERAYRDPRSALIHVLSRSGPEPLRIADLARRAYVSEAAAEEHVRALVHEGVAVALGGARFTAAENVEETRDAIVRTLNRFHDERPLVMGFPRKELLPAVDAPRPVTEHALARLLADGDIVSTAHGLRMSERAPSLSGPKAALAQTITGRFREAGLAAPRRDQIPAEVGAPAPVVEPLVSYLLQAGVLVALSDKVLLHSDTVAIARKELIEHLRTHGTIEVGEFKDLIHATRKYAVPLLEHFDRQGLTRRVGDGRVLRENREGDAGQTTGS
jgi:selenocysteine-specific elongation factor